MLNLKIEWRDKWHWWHGMYPSAYAKGKIAGPRHGVSDIYKHKTSGQVRLHSKLDMDGVLLCINSGPVVTMRPRGRSGNLYLGFDEA